MPIPKDNRGSFGWPLTSFLLSREERAAEGRMRAGAFNLLKVIGIGCRYQ